METINILPEGITQNHADQVECIIDVGIKREFFFESFPDDIDKFRGKLLFAAQLELKWWEQFFEERNE